MVVPLTTGGWSGMAMHRHRWRFAAICLTLVGAKVGGVGNAGE